MSFLSDPLGSIKGTLSSPKGLGELALLAAVGIATDGFGLAAAAPADVALGEGATTAAVTGGASGAAAGTALPALGAAAAPAAAAAGAAGVSPWLLGGAGALGGMLLAGHPNNNQPSPPTPTGPLSILHGAGGVRYPTSPMPTQNAASGGLMQINPNVPMSHNVVPQYATAQNTPVPQPVMNMSSGGNTRADQLPDISVQSSSPYDQYSQYIQNLLGSQQMAGDYGLSPQQIAAQQQQQQQPVSAAQGGMMYANGGSTGQLDVHGSIDIGGANNQMSGQSPNGYPSVQAQGAGGYSPAGGQVYGAAATQQLPQGIDPRAVAANPQGYQQFLQQARQQEQRYPGSTMFGQGQLGQLGQQGQQAGAFNPSVVPQALSQMFASGGTTSYAGGGGLSDLGTYSDGGRMLKGPGDGMSDSIPATIAGHQPARLANDEFVVPADVVSHLGNGSSDAGAKKLYEMMDRVRRARTGRPKQAKAIHPERYMPG